VSVRVISTSVEPAGTGCSGMSEQPGPGVRACPSQTRRPPIRSPRPRRTPQCWGSRPRRGAGASTRLRSQYGLCAHSFDHLLRVDQVLEDGARRADGDFMDGFGCHCSPWFVRPPRPDRAIWQDLATTTSRGTYGCPISVWFVEQSRRTPSSFGDKSGFAQHAQTSVAGRVRRAYVIDS
jgi:hypothetical protein